MSLGNQLGNAQQLMKQRKKRNQDHHNVIPAQIDKGLFTFNTRGFMIRYCEEEVELNDIGHFRVELDIEDSQPSNVEFFMEVELMFSDLQNQGGIEKFQQSSNLKEIDGNAEFKCVSVQKFKIRKLCDGIFDYVPVTFDEQHFCIALCTIHSSLLDFRFRSRELKPFSRAEYIKILDLEKKNQEGANKVPIEDKKAKAAKEKQDQGKVEEWRPQNIAEYLFSNEKGEIADDIDAEEIDQIYSGYMQALMTSYEKLKGKFNNFAAKCLSERQKRESGLLLVAPPLSLPGEKDNEADTDNATSTKSFNHPEESKLKENMIGSQNDNRMGGRLGARMEIAIKKDNNKSQVGVVAAHNQTVRAEDESQMNVDDDEGAVIEEESVYTNRRGLNQPKNLIEREPEREPDFSYREKMQGQKFQKSHKSNNIISGGNDCPEDDVDVDPEDEENGNQYNISNDGSLIISESNESILEMKKMTAIPILKNQDQFKSKISKENQQFDTKSSMYHNNKKNQLLPFSQRVRLQDPFQISFQLVQDINLVSSQVFQLWHKLIEIITINPKFICEYLRIQYEEKMREVQGEHIYRTIIETKDFAFPSDENVGEIHRQLAYKKRNGPNGSLLSSTTEAFNVIQLGSTSLSAQNSSSSNMESQKTGQQIQANKTNQNNNPQLQKALNELQPILFEECYIKSMDKIKQVHAELQPNTFNEYNYKGVHLFVMVHGFQGNACDMRLLRNNIALLFPEAMFLSSNANEDYTEGDIFEMGVRLSQEVNSYISQYCPGSSLGKISFIAHSLGGLIVRAALPFLEEHSDKMYNYFTLSSAHLGYMFTQSKIVDAGMWLLKTWRKSKCLQQLRMSDNKNLEETTLYKLSEFKGLNWFKHIVLVSSYQDSYAPFESARIQICNKAANDASRGNIYIKMARNLLSNLPVDVLYRIDVDFRIAEKNLDSFIGRTAHIQFLECQNVMRMLIYRFKEFFC
ncbi:serine [Stylonychia lemnae]|uniref:Serine n=1 Tax=Stylonychia lemnae TaxID=5949 RepID=A0A078AFG3_STYLE|nr:serine [Stylonychia lemnae]|eukprot:CDW80262.1 serine [Stylonychia lemnae]